MSNRVEPEIPTINIDSDQVKTAREVLPKSAQKSKTVNNNVKNSQGSSSGFGKTLIALMPYLALGVCGWYFYQQHIAVNAQLDNSIARIQQLENQLSATGEEMGESTIALKVKLESISEKTELLLTEMDKLWASAWRRNQNEIKELNSKSMKLEKSNEQQSNAIDLQNSTLSELKDKITATEFSISSVSEQLIALSSLKDDIKKLTAQLNKLDANAQSRDQQQMFTATTVNEFDTSLQLLLERVERLEAKLVN